MDMGRCGVDIPVYKFFFEHAEYSRDPALRLTSIEGLHLFEKRMDEAEQAYLCLCIEEERVIWDTSSDAYLSKTLRLQAWNRVHARMIKRGYSGTISNLQDMWKFLRAKYFRITHGKKSGCSAKSAEFVKNMKFLENVAIPTESTRYTNFDSGNKEMDPAECQPTTSRVSSVPVLGDLSNSVSSLTSFKRKRKISDDDKSTVREAAEAVMNKLDSMHVQDRYTYIGKFVETSLRRLPDDEADRKILQIMAIIANINLNENFEYRYQSPYQRSNL